MSEVVAVAGLDSECVGIGTATAIPVVGLMAPHQFHVEPQSHTNQPNHRRKYTRNPFRDRNIWFFSSNSDSNSIQTS